MKNKKGRKQCNRLALVLTKTRYKTLKDLRATLSVKIHVDINDQVLPGYDQW